MTNDFEPGIYESGAHGWTLRKVPSGRIPPDITWLMGRHLAAVEKMDWSWFFRLDDGSLIDTGSTWRIVTPRGVVVASEDHDQGKVTVSGTFLDARSRTSTSLIPDGPVASALSVTWISAIPGSGRSCVYEAQQTDRTG